MFISPGEVAWAFVKPRVPRGGVSFRVGRQRLVLRLSPWSFTDDRGDGWIDVFPVRRKIEEVRLDPDTIVTIPVDDVTKLYGALTSEAFGAILEVLGGDDPRYPWLNAYDDEPTPPPPGVDFPTIREILERQDQRPQSPAPDAGDEPG